MRELPSNTQDALSDVAERTGFSLDAVKSMFAALVSGQGGMAQFNHPEFGGHGQWMRGGMTMVSDMFNHHLKARVDALCAELAQILAQQPELAREHQAASFSVQSGQGSWWPSDLGQPNSSGAQNGARYAYFANARRLAIDAMGAVTVYDTQDHQITGVSQQQSGRGSLTFTSQHGPVDVAALPLVSGAPQSPKPAAPAPSPSASPGAGSSDVFATIEKLADLKAKGHLSAEEFAAKKSELLSRL